MAEWLPRTSEVLQAVLQERIRQVAQYGHNHDLDNGTGPTERWLWELGTWNHARSLQRDLRAGYEWYEAEHGKPTWMHLVREEIAEAFQENDPARLEEELVQVAALCVSWVETLRHNKTSQPTVGSGEQEEPE